MQYFIPIVKKLEYKSNKQRRDMIIELLKNKKIKYKLEGYRFFGNKGKNIIIEFGNGKKYSIASAHYDVVSRSPGANDDASAMAVLLKVIDKLNRIKIKNKIKIIFFDQEEIGRFGSRSYIEKYGLKNLIGIYNLELVGMGDIIGLWPITNFNKDSYILKIIEKVTKEKNIYTERIGQLPAFYGDDLSFREAGFEHSLCISVAYKKDKEKIKKFVKSPIPYILLRYYLGLIPKMFKLYHSPNDKSEYLNESAMEMTADVLTKSLINLDKTF